MNEFYTILNSFGAMFGLFLSTAFIFRKEGDYAQKVLGASIMSLSFIIVTNYMSLKGFNTPAFFIRGPVTYIYWPLFYFYVSLMTLEMDRLRLKSILHFIPFALVFGFRIILWFTEQPDDFFKTALEIESVVRLFYGWIYCILMIRELLKYRRKIEEYFSDIEKVNLMWLTVLVSVYTVIWMSGTLYMAFRFIGNSMPQSFDYAIVFLNVTMVLWICIIGYFAMTNPGLFRKIHVMSFVIPSDSDEKKNATSLNDNFDKEHVEKLKSYIESEKPYLNGELTLSMLADAVDMQPYLLSKLINSSFEQNFFSLINAYRIEEVKSRLSDPENIEDNILSVAYSCGFRSKSGFNATFKKITGKTPSEFRNEMKKRS